MIRKLKLLTKHRVNLLVSALLMKGQEHTATRPERAAQALLRGGRGRTRVPLWGRGAKAAPSEGAQGQTPVPPSLPPAGPPPVPHGPAAGGGPEAGPGPLPAGAPRSPRDRRYLPPYSQCSSSSSASSGAAPDTAPAAGGSSSVAMAAAGLRGAAAAAAGGGGGAAAPLGSRRARARRSGGGSAAALRRRHCSFYGGKGGETPGVGAQGPRAARPALPGPNAALRAPRGRGAARPPNPPRQSRAHAP